MNHITPYSPRKRTHTKSTNNVQKLVPSSSKWHARPLESEMTKIMKDFIWDGNKRGLMRLDYTAKIREKGGLGMPDLKTRMKAIDIMWLKKILDTPDKRPTWCWVADALIDKDAYLHLAPRVEESARLKWALQTWRTREGNHSRLPECLRLMLKVAEKYNTRVHARQTWI